jgi:two-component system sensor histidine kinase HydH
MNRAERRKPDRLFLASPWLLATASLLLAFIIGVFAVSNFQREKKLMNMALAQEGRAVLNLISSSSRAAFRNLMMQKGFSREAWLESVQEVIENGTEHQEILSLFLVNDTGLIVSHNETAMVGKDVDGSTVSFLRSLRKQNQGPNSRILPKTSGTEQRFQIAALFNPIGARNEMLSAMKDGARGRMGRWMRDNPPSHDLQGFSDKKLYLVAELDMTAFQNQVRKQFIYIVILSIVLLLVGIGGLLSLVAIQGFKGSQRRLKTITAFTDVLISSMPLGIIAIDPAGNIKTCNVSGQSMFGIERNVIGKNYADIFPEELSRTIQTLSSEVSSIGDAELTISDKGVSKNLHIMCVPIDSGDDGGDTGHMLLIQDLTTQKNLELEIRRNERHTAVGKMAAGVAHELRNPLSSIKGLALLLKSKFELQSSGGEAAEILISEVERLDRSISELLDYSRPETLELKKLQLVEPIKKAIRLIRSDAQAERIEIIEKYEDENRVVEGDQDKLTQLFLNLLLNSIQAMQHGGTLTISTQHSADKATVIVADSGQGIDEVIKEKIFDPYFTTKNDGTGLGLSLSAKIIEDHRGSINIDSDQGNGTTVIVTFPA